MIDWTKLPSLTALRAFDATARAKSFSGAARTLNVTHAAVAQQVSALEEYLGVTLVQRSTRGIALTPEGSDLSARLAEGFSAIAEGIATLSEKQAARPIRATTTSYFAESVIFPRIADFWRVHPGVEISFTPSDEALDIVGAGLDLAVRAGPGDWPGLRSTHLIDSPTVACAAAHLIDNPSTDWSSVPWLLPNDTTWERQALEASGIDVATIRAIDVGDPALEIRAGEEGLGLVLESEIDLRPRLDAGTLKIAPIPIRHTSSYHVVTPPWRPRPAVSQFIDWLKSSCGEPST